MNSSPHLPSKTSSALIILLSLVGLARATDYYATLEVNRMSSEEQIKKAYKTKLIKMHPDRFPADKKKEMEEKFKKVQEAYDVLGNPHLKMAYDRAGHAGVEQAKKDQQARDQWETQNRMREEQFKQHQQNQDPLANSRIELINLENISKFHRRYQVWTILFYKPGDQDINVVSPILEKLRSDYDGIFTVARINCLEEEELCKEFLVYGTPKIMVFPSYSGFDGKELDYADELLAAKRGDTIKFLAYVASEAINQMEDFVTFLNENTVKDFEEKKGLKLVLFTAKNNTPPLWKALSKEFKNSASFGIARGQDSELSQKFKIEKFPTILGFKFGWLTNPVTFSSEFKIDAIKTFVRDLILSGEDQREELQLLEERDLWQNRHCGSQDKKYCLFFLSDDKNSEPLAATLNVLKKELAKEPFKLAVVETTYFDPALMAENGLAVLQPNMIIVKGFVNRAEAFDAGDFDIATIRDHINNLLSSITSLKRIRQPLENYVAVISKEL